MIDTSHSLLLILVIALVSFGIRFLPFLLFSKKTPPVFLYLSRVLPCAVIGMLVVYCLRNVSVWKGSHGLPEAIAAAAVVLLYKWKHSTLVSILAGTVCYMLLVQLVF